MTDNEFELGEVENQVSSDARRVCPVGQHDVKTHPEHIPPSKKHPDGHITTRHEHCADNPTLKVELSFDKIHAISDTQFSNLTGPPKAGVLHFSRADEFDQYIRGWVHYWNEINPSDDPLDANLVKALMASESSFDPNMNKPTNNKKLGNARGLMQLTDDTFNILGNHKRELKDHFISLTGEEVYDPSANISAAVRWLFRKKITAQNRLNRHHQNRKATWDDAVAEYKGILKGTLNKKNKHPDRYHEMSKFHDFYKKLSSS